MLRTVIQADGDVVCFVDEAHRTDVAALGQHLAAVRAWADHFATTIAAATTLLHRLALSASALVGAVLAVSAGRVWALLVAVGMSLATIIAAGLGRAVSYVATTLRWPAERGGALARVAQWSVVLLAALVAGITTQRGGRATELVVGALILALGLLPAWAAQALLRRKLGLRPARL